jgi:L-alanine-DL-glutamate epimerase-like enolase superfamily enzyme
VDAAVDGARAQAYTIPTDLPEADGTASCTSTTIVVVQVKAAGRRGLGYTYSDASVARLINEKLAPIVIGRDVMDPPAAWRAMNVAVRNLGRDGLSATAISALDTALWDLKAVVLDQPLASLLGRYRTPFRFTAAVASPAMMIVSWRVSWRDG